jgi:hypothetical protein
LQIANEVTGSFNAKGGIREGEAPTWGPGDRIGPREGFAGVEWS